MAVLTFGQLAATTFSYGVNLGNSLPKIGQTCEQPSPEFPVSCLPEFPPRPMPWALCRQTPLALLFCYVLGMIGNTVHFFQSAETLRPFLNSGSASRSKRMPRHASLAVLNLKIDGKWKGPVYSINTTLGDQYIAIYGDSEVPRAR